MPHKYPLLGLALFLIALPAAAATNTQIGTIQQIYAYDDYPGTEILIRFDTGVSECSAGVYLNRDAPGFESLRDLAFLSISAKRPIYFQVYADRLLNGTKPYCEVDAVRVQNPEDVSEPLNYAEFQVAVENAILATQLAPTPIDYDALQAAVSSAIMTYGQIEYAAFANAMASALSNSGNSGSQNSSSTAGYVFWSAAGSLTESCVEVCSKQGAISQASTDGLICRDKSNNPGKAVYTGSYRLGTVIYNDAKFCGADILGKCRCYHP
jgi:hypothetical protein